MIVIDLSQILISNLFAHLGPKRTEVDENLIRHMILNSIRAYNMKFKGNYGRIVICCDNKSYWRKDIFPYYKANRKKDRDSSNLDWSTIFDSLNKVRDELQEFFPYKVMNVPGAEADDIIAVITKYMCEDEKILIISGDKDFAQLQTSPNVIQFAPVQKKYIKVDNPKLFLYEHIIVGDRGDGIPNFMSNDDTFVTGQRQRVITQKNLSKWLDTINEDASNINEIFDARQQHGWHRNRTLVDFNYIPEEISNKIIEVWLNTKAAKPNRLMDYFMENRLRNLMDSIQEFL